MTALIVIAVIVVVIALILSLSATVTVVYDNKWRTTISVLWINKDVELSKILTFLLFPQESAQKVKDEAKKKSNKKANKKSKAANKPSQPVQPEKVAQKADAQSASVSVSANSAEPQAAQLPTDENNNKDDKNSTDKKQAKPAEQKKPNFIKNIWDKDGIVGIMLFVSNMVESASGAVSTLFRGFHIYSLYVKILVGGGDADSIARAYGKICKYYYPLKGAIINGMKVDNYNDWIAPDFIMPQNEYGLQFIGSLSVGTILHVALSAGKIFVVNLIKDK